MIGDDIERVEDEYVDIEFFPDRPDLYSVEGAARAMQDSHLTGDRLFCPFGVYLSDRSPEGFTLCWFAWDPILAEFVFVKSRT